MHSFQDFGVIINLECLIIIHPPKQKNNWIFVEVPVSPKTSSQLVRLGLERSVAIHLHLVRLNHGEVAVVSFVQTFLGANGVSFFSPMSREKHPHKKEKKKINLERGWLVVAFFLLGFGYD